MSLSEPHSVVSATVLIVDDNLEMVEFLQFYLSRHGLRVISAYSGKQCLELASQYAIDLVVLDVMMLGVNGIETCAALKSLPVTQEIPVLLLTARDDKETRLAGRKLGVCEFLVKPIRGKELLDHIRLQLAVRRRERQLDNPIKAARLDWVQL